MKKEFKKVALFLVLGMAMTACQKENLSNDMVGMEQTESSIHAVYAIDGKLFDAVFSSEDAWNDFISQMLALAREGHEVVFSRNGNIGISVSKEKVTFVTTSEQEAHHWAHDMMENGYTVSIEFNKVTGEYTCTAIK